MTARWHADVLNDAVNGVVDNFDKGTTNPNGSMEFYTGVPPANLGDAPGATLLAVVDFQNPACSAGGAGALNDGQAEALGVPLGTTGIDDGPIGWVRIIDRDGVARNDEDDVGTSGNVVTLNTTTVSTGVDFALNSYLASIV